MGPLLEYATSLPKGRLNCHGPGLGGFRGFFLSTLGLCSTISGSWGREDHSHQVSALFATGMRLVRDFSRGI